MKWAYSSQPHSAPILSTDIVCIYIQFMVFCVFYLKASGSSNISSDSSLQ